jgi:hypothetical protein
VHRIPNDYGREIKNMGGYYRDKKDTVENCNSISISFLRKNGYFNNNHSGQICWTDSITGEETGNIGITVSITEAEKFIRFNYTVTNDHIGEKTDYDYKVSLTTTPCNLKGVRYWFICPLAINGVCCGRRVAKLYKAPDSDYFGCRHCYNLSYESRNEPRFARFGGIAYPMKTERQYKELLDKTKRWTWKGKPTRKAKKLHSLKQKKYQALSLISKLFTDSGWRQGCW